MKEYICPTCSKIFSLSPKRQRVVETRNNYGPYCSPKCFYEDRRQRTDKRREQENLTININGICETCGGDILGKARRHAKYCSIKCMGLGNSLKNGKLAHIKAYEAGDYSKCVYSDGQTMGWFRDYIKEQKGWKCELCGWGEANPHNGRIYVELDHIDGDCFNSRRENLRVICPNCHTLTANYKALNRGNIARTNIVTGMVKKSK